MENLKSQTVNVNGGGCRLTRYGGRVPSTCGDEMSRIVTLDVPGEPKPQSRPRSRAIKKNGKWIGTTYQPSGPDMDYRTKISTLAAAKINGSQPLEGPLWVSIELYVTKPKSKPKYKILPDVKPDVDNYVKAILDALEGILFKNDSQVCTLVVAKKYAINRCASTQIIVEELKEKR